MNTLAKHVEDRVLLDGLKGRRVAWLNYDGNIDSVVLRHDVVELPRCFEELDSLDETAARAAEDLGLEVHTIVRWEGGVLPLQAGPTTLGPAVGFLLA